MENSTYQLLSNWVDKQSITTDMFYNNSLELSTSLQEQNDSIQITNRGYDNS